ncbi:MAG: Crp/Fnr family transcriptional regulator [Bacteroidales bacterium]|nr:Crp/Fnr family transcriptional regulator [Bacteroidales bacterium]
MNEVKYVCDCKECIIRNLIFKHLRSEEFQEVCRSKTQKSFKKGQVVFEKGQLLEHLIYLKSGLVKYYYSTNEGKVNIISLSIPFDAFSLLTILHNEQISIYSMSVLEDSTLCYIPLSLIKNLIHINGDFALDFISKLIETSNKTIEQFLTLHNKNLRGRVAYFMLYLSDNIYKKNIFELPVSRKEIAEIIGMTTENVIRTLSEFRKEKIIKINGKEIEILEKERLSKISQYG